MSLIDSSVLTIINQICNSHGDFNDELIENSFFFKIISEKDWIYKLKQVSICHNDDLILQNEKKLLYIEEKMKNIFGNLDLYKMQDFNVFINILYSQIKRKQFFFLKKNKIQEMLENLKYEHNKCMEKFSSYEKMCISRLIFDENEHEKLYNEYKGIKKNDLTWQPIKILVLDNKEKICNYLLKKKCTPTA